MPLRSNKKALQLGLHTMIFSDNIDLQEEIRIKRYAQAHNLLAMGPHLPVQPSSTVSPWALPMWCAERQHWRWLRLGQDSSRSCLLDRPHGRRHFPRHWQRQDGPACGCGWNHHARGHCHAGKRFCNRRHCPHLKTGGADRGPKGTGCGREERKTGGRELHSAGPPSNHTSLHYATTLAEAAALAGTLSGVELLDQPELALSASHKAWISQISSRFAADQKYIRGLFSGGTFCYEALPVARRTIGRNHSNTAAQPEVALKMMCGRAGQHTLLDMGDD